MEGEGRERIGKEERRKERGEGDTSEDREEGEMGKECGKGVRIVFVREMDTAHCEMQSK